MTPQEIMQVEEWTGKVFDLLHGAELPNYIGYMVLASALSTLVGDVNGREAGTRLGALLSAAFFNEVF
jgi:hypothetical protein